MEGIGPWSYCPGRLEFVSEYVVFTGHPSQPSSAAGLEGEAFPRFLARGQELPKTPASLVQLAAEVDGFETHSWALIPQAAPLVAQAAV